MGTTNGGIPYPEGTDRVVDGDDAMRNIAVAVNDRTTYGGTIRVIQSANQSGYGASWIAAPFDTTPAAINPAVPPGVRWDAPNRGFVIMTAGIYYIFSTFTMSGGAYSIRLRVTTPTPARTLAFADASTQAYTCTTSAFTYLPAGAVVKLEVFVVSGGLVQVANTNDNPNTFGITHLPYIP